MNKNMRSTVTLAGFALLGVLAYFGARYWQSSEAGITRIEPAAPCDLRAGACSQPVAGGSVSLAIEPRDIPLMQTLQLTVSTTGLPVSAVSVDIRGLNMDMGLNRTVLERGEEGRWRGETILPVCSQRHMQWEAAVRLDAAPPLEVPFAFATLRP